LSWEEFSSSRKPGEAKKWFGLRDANRDGSLSRDEFVSGTPALPTVN